MLTSFIQSSDRLKSSGKRCRHQNRGEDEPSNQAQVEGGHQGHLESDLDGADGEGGWKGTSGRQGVREEQIHPRTRWREPREGRGRLVDQGDPLDHGGAHPRAHGLRRSGGT